MAIAGIGAKVSLAGHGTTMSTSHPVSDSASGPLVTIAIPTFNRASWLKDCILSALSQTYQHFEILVSNNASTDETEQVLREFTDRRLRVVRQQSNIGLHRNWNACLAAARGEYIIFVPDDDRIAPWLLERCIGLVEKEPQIPIVIALSTTHSPSLGQTWPPKASKYLATGIWDGTEVLLEYLKDEITINMCSILLRTVAIRARGGFPLDFPHTADLAGWTPLLLTGKAGLVNEAGATWCIHDATETARLSVEQILCDGWKVADLISKLADCLINDLQRRRRIRVESSRCFARRGLITLDLYRNRGGRLLEVLMIIWRFRHRFLSNIDMENLRRVRWHIAFILCRRQIAWIGRIKRSVMVWGS
jgi:glycosyltransferase involved in cell wall biosynthesis